VYFYDNVQGTVKLLCASRSFMDSVILCTSLLFFYLHKMEVAASKLVTCKDQPLSGRGIELEKQPDLPICNVRLRA